MTLGNFGPRGLGKKVDGYVSDSTTEGGKNLGKDLGDYEFEIVLTLYIFAMAFGLWVFVYYSRRQEAIDNFCDESAIHPNDY